MTWNEILPKIVNYVEEQLKNGKEIDPAVIASLSACSYSFFGKLFSYHMRMGFAEYVRSRKLTLAGYDLQSSSISILELASRYGYDSPTSFTKAFSKFHGISPRMARKQHASLKVVTKLACLEQAYTWRIVHKKGFCLSGCSTLLEQPFWTQIPKFWNT